eukprot:scpid60987/ scgid27038/ 
MLEFCYLPANRQELLTLSPQCTVVDVEIRSQVERPQATGQAAVSSHMINTCTAACSVLYALRVRAPSHSTGFPCHGHDSTLELTLYILQYDNTIIFLLSTDIAWSMGVCKQD